MSQANYNELIKETLSQLQYAQGELQRPSKDVVSISVCNTSRESMKAIMHVFLLSRGVNIETRRSIRELMDNCVKVEPDFASISLKGVGCNELDQTACDGKYCMGHEEVDACLTTANKIKDLVLKKMNIKEAN